MKERPILFSAPMVRAILEGRKTMTRRIMKVQPYESEYEPGLFHMMYRAPETVVREGKVYDPITKAWTPEKSITRKGDIISASGGIGMYLRFCPYGHTGDRLWVRETFAVSSTGAIYRADPMFDSCAKGDISWKWKPSIFMPRQFSRITLEITNVRVERLQNISEDDARAEGVEKFASGWKNYTDPAVVCQTAKASFHTLWESINGPGSWEANPWVWVVEFKAIQK